VDSRGSEGGRAVRRRRACLLCGKRFTTYERPEEALRVTVIKKDGSREPYERRKVIDGLQKACYKRPITDEQIRRVVEEVEDEIFRSFDREVPSNFIGDAVIRHLRDVDKIAYLRFASVYREFKEVGELIDVAEEVKDAPVAGPDQSKLFENR
jgi:transcriptional repressor NrdR